MSTLPATGFLYRLDIVWLIYCVVRPHPQLLTSVQDGEIRFYEVEKRKPWTDGDSERLREKARFEADQSRLLQRRVEDLEAELESVRASAKKDRDFQKQRIQALVSRVAALEGGI